MKTIFSQNKINEYSSCNGERASAIKQLSIFAPNTMRHSLSPNKVKTSKKFFYPHYNKSIKQLSLNPQSRHELQELLLREKIIISAKPSKFNDLLVPFENQGNNLLTFPSIEIKKISEGNNKLHTPRKFRDMSNTEEKNHQREERKQYHSNILFTDLRQQLESANAIKYFSQMESPSPEKKIQKKTIIIPKIYKKMPVELETISPVLINSEQSTSQFSSRLNQARSQVKIQNLKESIQKKYKKGYLAYQHQGLQYWQKVKQKMSQPNQTKLQSHKLITAKIYFVLNLQTLQPVISYKQNQHIQIASLSKIMTCYLTILICKKYQVDMKNCIYRVPDKIAETPGTSAELEAGDLLCVEDLLYALMLPSGNDASICLAELMGKVLQRYRKKQPKKSFFETFMIHMNMFSKELGLNQEWNNSSGLSLNPNFSTAKDIIALSALALKNQLFCKIVTTKQIQLSIKNDRYGLNNKRSWKNTNKLLEKGWEGVKTGTTETAGHCLIAKKQNWLVGVFDCQTMSKRFSDSVKLYQYIRSKCGSEVMQQ